MKNRFYTGLVIVFSCCLAINSFAQITPETALMSPDIETIIGLQMPGGNEIMETINIVSDVDNNNAITNTIENEEIEEQVENDVYDNITANIDGNGEPITIEDEIDKEELIIRKGIVEGLENKLVLYPNPAINFINMEMDETGMYRVEIFNLIGSLVYSDQVEIGKNISLQVNLQDYHTGMYILNVSNDNMQVTKKFAVKK